MIASGGVHVSRGVYICKAKLYFSINLLLTNMVLWASTNIHRRLEQKNNFVKCKREHFKQKKGYQVFDAVKAKRREYTSSAWSPVRY